MRRKQRAGRDKGGASQPKRRLSDRFRKPRAFALDECEDAYMNAGLDADHSSIYYNDGDYPSEESPFPENFDQVTTFQAIRHDVARYKDIAAQIGGPILELCCGTGRVAIPLARQGCEVTAVDVSPAILERFRENLWREHETVAGRIAIVEQDITTLSLEKTDYRLGLIAFNSLLLITSGQAQIEALRRVAAHLASGALLLLDCVNPLRLKIDGDPVPRRFFTRRNPHNGKTYTRFAMFDRSMPINASAFTAGTTRSAPRARSRDATIHFTGARSSDSSWN
jgi:SAM-dependent methyltransferase